MNVWSSNIIWDVSNNSLLPELDPRCLSIGTHGSERIGETLRTLRRSFHGPRARWPWVLPRLSLATPWLVQLSGEERYGGFSDVFFIHLYLGSILMYLRQPEPPRSSGGPSVEVHSKPEVMCWCSHASIDSLICSIVRIPIGLSIFPTSKVVLCGTI